MNDDGPIDDPAAASAGSIGANGDLDAGAAAEAAGDPGWNGELTTGFHVVASAEPLPPAAAEAAASGFMKSSIPAIDPMFPGRYLEHRGFPAR